VDSVISSVIMTIFLIQMVHDTDG